MTLTLGEVLGAVVAAGICGLGLWWLITAQDNSSCFDCGHEFDLEEEVHLEVRSWRVLAFCSRCWARRQRHGLRP